MARAKPYIWKPKKFPNFFPRGKRPRGLGQSILAGAGGTAPDFFAPLANSGLGGAPPGGGGGGGGGSPYAGLLQDYLNQQRADFAAQGAAEKGDMLNALRKYIISYGSSPNFDQMGGLGKDAQGYLKEALDPKTLDLAKKAEEEGLSAHARLGQVNERATRMIPAALASRGILHSGQTGSDLSSQAMQYKQSGYDMLNEMLGGITGSVSNFQNAERERQRALAEAEMQAAWQAAQDWRRCQSSGDTRPHSIATSVVGVLLRDVAVAVEPRGHSDGYRPDVLSVPPVQSDLPVGG
jgi:hypothetical protein